MDRHRLRLVLVDEPDPADRDYVHQQIKAFNDASSEHHRTLRRIDASPLDILIRDKPDRLLGGLVSSTYWGWLDIKDLWIDEAVRGRGLGRELLLMAEAEAIARGCVRASVQTFSFQARGFYEKLGYQVVGRLDDYPPGQTFFWMRKNLASSGGGARKAAAD